MSWEPPRPVDGGIVITPSPIQVFADLVIQVAEHVEDQIIGELSVSARLSAKPHVAGDRHAR